LTTCYATPPPDCEEAAGHHPLDRVSNVSKAGLTVQISRLIDEAEGFQLLDAERGVERVDINGDELSYSACDYLRLVRSNGKEEIRRVKVKCARPFFTKRAERWRICFRRVKFECFDDLVLVADVPGGIEIWEYNVPSKIGVHKQGKATNMLGHSVSFEVVGKEHDMNNAWSDIKTLVESKHAATISREIMVADELWKHPKIMPYLQPTMAARYTAIPEILFRTCQQ
jgi:hypothetical protein